MLSSDNSCVRTSTSCRPCRKMRLWSCSIERSGESGESPTMPNTSRTVRDVFGMVGDSPLSPLRSIEQDQSRIFLQGLQLVDVRTQLLSLDSMREGATDDYSLLRDAWLQRRHYQIFGEGKQD